MSDQRAESLLSCGESLDRLPSHQRAADRIRDRTQEHDRAVGPRPLLPDRIEPDEPHQPARGQQGDRHQRHDVLGSEQVRNRRDGDDLALLELGEPPPDQVGGDALQFVTLWLDACCAPLVGVVHQFHVPVEQEHVAAIHVGEPSDTAQRVVDAGIEVGGRQVGEVAQDAGDQLEESRRSCQAGMRSKMAARPCPPPMHIVSRPKRASRRSSS